MKGSIALRFLAALASIRMLVALAVIVALPCIAFSQAVPVLNLDSPGVLDGHPKDAGSSIAPPAPLTPPSSTITIPAGTRVMLTLTSPIHSTASGTGSGMYLETTYPLIQGDRVAVPAHTQVQGVVESASRPGHFKRGAQFHFRFTNLVFSNQHVASIDGNLQSLPGSRGVEVSNKTGDLKQVDQFDKHLVGIAGMALAGGVIGSVGRFGIGKFVGAGLGAGIGVGSVVLTRGDELAINVGQPVEMILAQPLVLDVNTIPTTTAPSALLSLPHTANPARAESCADGERCVPRQRRRRAQACSFVALS